MEMELKAHEIIFLEGFGGTTGITKSAIPRTLFMNTPDDEVAIFLEPEELIVISSFATGDTVRRGMKALAYLIMELGNPLVVLPEGHPGSKRLRMVVSAANNIKLNCNITPGTHPDHSLLCSSPDLSGVEIASCSGGVVIKNLPEEIQFWKEELDW